MAPLGLTFKNIKTNRYTGRTSGELMIVHYCVNCCHISCNRIAGDDNNYSISCLLDEPKILNDKIQKQLKEANIALLNQNDREEVLASIYGFNYQKYIS
jgi:hypothetical protein